MKKCYKVLLWILITAVGISFFSCKDESSDPTPLPAGEPLSDVKVFNYGLDSDFDTNGIINMDILPLDDTGKGILDNSVSISAQALYEDYSGEEITTRMTIGYVGSKTPSTSTLPWAFAIDIDSSGSMSSTDPSRLRVDAAKQFVTDILAEKSTSLFGIYDFGSSTYDTTRYTYNSDTRELLAFSGDKTAIDSAIDQVLQSGGTPLYDSVYELLDTFNTDIAAAQYERAMLVLSDGSPNDYALEQDVYDRSVAYGIPINTVVLGSGSYYTTMQDLASETGGIFTSADDATDLTTAFTNITLGTTQGYMTYQLKFPDVNDMPSSYDTFDVNVTVTSGGISKTATLTFN